MMFEVIVIGGHKDLLQNLATSSIWINETWINEEGYWGN